MRFEVASPDYFKAMGVPLVAGRFFEATDEVGKAPVVLINQALAAHYWEPGNSVDHDPMLRRRTGEGFSAPYQAEDSNDSVEEAWTVEIGSRIDDILSGKAATIPHAEVMARLAEDRAARHAARQQA